jgi:integrase
MLIKNLRKKFYKSPDFLNLAPATRKNYDYILTPFFLKFEAVSLKETESKKFLNAYRIFLSEQNDKKKERLIRHVRIIFNFAKREMLLKTAPAAMIKIRRSAVKSRKVWTEKDFQSYFDAAQSEIKKFLIISKETGLRRSDLLELKYSNIEFKNNFYFFKIKQQKTGNFVYIPLSEKCLSVIFLEKIGDEDFILKNQSGKKLTVFAIKSARSRIRKKLNRENDGLNFAGLRPTRCVNLASAGCNEIEISSLLGWSINTAREMMDRHYLTQKIEPALAAARKMQDFLQIEQK